MRHGDTKINQKTLEQLASEIGRLGLEGKRTRDVPDMADSRLYWRNERRMWSRIWLAAAMILFLLIAFAVIPGWPAILFVLGTASLGIHGHVRAERLTEELARPAPDQFVRDFLGARERF